MLRLLRRSTHEATVEVLRRRLADKDHVIDLCEQDRNALAAERDEANRRADRLQAELDEARKVIGQRVPELEDRCEASEAAARRLQATLDQLGRQGR